MCGCLLQERCLPQKSSTSVPRVLCNSGRHVRETSSARVFNHHHLRKVPSNCSPKRFPENALPATLLPKTCLTRQQAVGKKRCSAVLWEFRGNMLCKLLDTRGMRILLHLCCRRTTCTLVVKNCCAIRNQECSTRVIFKHGQDSWRVLQEFSSRVLPRHVLYKVAGQFTYLKCSLPWIDDAKPRNHFYPSKNFKLTRQERATFQQTLAPASGFPAAVALPTVGHQRTRIFLRPRIAPSLQIPEKDKLNGRLKVTVHIIILTWRGNNCAQNMQCVKCAIA